MEKNDGLGKTVFLLFDRSFASYFDFSWAAKRHWYDVDLFSWKIFFPSLLQLVSKAQATFH